MLVVLAVLLPLTLGWSMAQRTLNVSLSQAPYIIDPTANWLYDVPANMFVPLVQYSYTSHKVSPAGAVSWTVSSDGTTYTFHIRQGWTWSNGQPVTAGDFLYSFQRTVDPKVAAPDAYRLYAIQNAQAINEGKITDLSKLGVSAPDDHTLVIHLVKPASWFLVSLSSIGLSVPKADIQAHGNDWTKPENIVVDGPYKLTKLVPGDHAVLEKNPTYFDADKVAIDRINLYVVKQASTAMSMYQAGELDTVPVPPEDLDQVKKDPKLSKEFYNGPELSLYYYDFNVHKAPFDNVDVRKAFAAAIDRKGIVEYVTKGGEVPAQTLTPPGSVGYVPPSANVGIPYDPSQAKAYLAKAGYPNGKGLPPITLAFNASELNSKIAQAVQQMWQQTLGATVNLQSVEGRAYSQIAGKGAFNVWRMGWGMDYPDANDLLAGLFTTAVGTPALLHDTQFDKLVSEAAVAHGVDARTALYTQAEKIYVQDDAAVVPIYWGAENILTQPYLNRPHNPTLNREFWTWSWKQ